MAFREWVSPSVSEWSDELPDASSHDGVGNLRGNSSERLGHPEGVARHDAGRINLHRSKVGGAAGQVATVDDADDHRKPLPVLLCCAERGLGEYEVERFNVKAIAEAGQHV